MAPYFETVKSFADVSLTDDGIDTQAFLEASDGLVQMFDLLGSGVFGFVQSDLRSNIAGVRARYESTRDASATVEGLVRSEVPEAHKHGTPCLVRLTRGLAFTCQALQNMQSDTSSELHICFKRSYDTVLRHHHSFIIRSVVLVAIRAVPRRTEFYARIAQGGSIEKLDAELARWLVGLDALVKRIIIIVRHRNRVARTVAGCVVGSFFLLFIAFCIFMIHRDSRRRARAAAPTTSESRLSAPPPASGPRAAPTLRSVSVLTVGRRPLFSPWRGRRRGGGVTIVVSNSNSGGVGGEPLAEIEKVSDVDLEKQALQQSAVMGGHFGSRTGYKFELAVIFSIEMSSSTLPLELIYAIIDELSGDKPALSACSLTSSSLRGQAQKHLFSKVVLYLDAIDPWRADNLHGILYSNPQLASLVVSLEVHISERPGLEIVIIRHFSLLNRFPRVRSVALTSSYIDFTQWRDMQDDLRIPLLMLIQQPSVETLTLVYQGCLPPQILSHCLQLKHLIMERCRLQDSRYQPRMSTEIGRRSHGGQQGHLESLRLDAGYSPLLATLIHPSSPLSFSRLHTLFISSLQTTPANMLQNILDAASLSLVQLSLAFDGVFLDPANLASRVTSLRALTHLKYLHLSFSQGQVGPFLRIITSLPPAVYGIKTRITIMYHFERECLSAAYLEEWRLLDTTLTALHTAEVLAPLRFVVFCDRRNHGLAAMQRLLPDLDAQGCSRMGMGPGEVYNPYGAAGAAEVGVARARSTRDPGAFAHRSGSQEVATPLRFPGPGTTIMADIPTLTLPTTTSSPTSTSTTTESTSSPTSQPPTTTTTTTDTSTTTSDTTTTSETSTTDTTQSTTETTTSTPPTTTQPPITPTTTDTSTTGGNVITTTSIFTATPTLPPATGTAAPSNNNNGFFDNTGAVAGVFTVVGLVALALLVAFITNIIRRRRAKRFDREIAEAAAEAAAAPAPIFLDDDGADDEDDDGRRYGSTNGGGGGGVGAPYSDVSSHGTYSQAPMNAGSGAHESYGMREMGMGMGMGPGPGEVYNPYGAAGAAGVGVARARSTRDPGAFASGLQEGTTPYPAFARPGHGYQPYNANHNVGNNNNNNAYGAGVGYDRGPGSPEFDLLDAAGMGAGAGAGAGVGAGMKRGISLNHNANSIQSAPPPMYPTSTSAHAYPYQHPSQAEVLRQPSQARSAESTAYSHARSGSGSGTGTGTGTPQVREGYATHYAGAPAPQQQQEEEEEEDAYGGYVGDVGGGAVQGQGYAQGQGQGQGYGQGQGQGRGRYESEDEEEEEEAVPAPRVLKVANELAYLDKVGDAADP
ncbi:hypothetical protein D9615_009229 [Tricholomella constricta]|uniref:Glycolipid transfer protein domain-containing protein n=1 Tax=Tricholomella constricta TaxID=117010 RepID=A0A8H5GWL2_9AGAR|nr:hypothetical protein D9615_009229 [Tricholomella constricta]